MQTRERSAIFIMMENYTLKKELALVPLYLQSHTMIVLQFTIIQHREKVIFYDHQHLFIIINNFHLTLQ